MATDTETKKINPKIDFMPHWKKQDQCFHEDKIANKYDTVVIASKPFGIIFASSFSNHNIPRHDYGTWRNEIL